MYRAVAYAAGRAGVALDDEEGLGRLLEDFPLEMSAGSVRLGEEDITLAIRSPEITAASSPVATSRVVRRHLARMQRAVAAGRNVVTEGRDQGTVVFPDAVCKFFLVAEPEERARRRLAELAARGEVANLSDVQLALEARDQRDSARDLDPLRPADDALLLDTTRLSPDEVVERMLAAVLRRRPDA